MELLNIDCLGRPLRLEGSMTGWQQLFWNNRLVSQQNATVDSDGQSQHSFTLTGQDVNGEAQEILVTLDIQLQWQPFVLDYQIQVNGEIQSSGQRTTKDIERQTPQNAPPTPQRFSLVGLVSLGFKLLKSTKVIKVVLVGASVTAYSWLFSFQFALALIACLMFHEYGHIRAMQYFGMKTKGIYLIPFIGGLALSDEKINTRWQDVVISIMGPTFGLFMSLTCLLLYWLTGEMLFAGLATFNALLNLFNLLPILPLDGGHILKSISFSMNSIAGLLACIGGAAIGVYVSYSFGLALLGFLLLIGSLEIIFEWRSRHHSHLLPLDRYGQIFSTVWYLLTVTALIGIIWYFAGMGDEMLGLPLKILQS
ncbi:MAG: site-2 protease family protein [Shewanella sp.]|nr:site-2 protease family protein [Shewanella sp.]MCF1430707.1 site-2 protease family protein [Shewanella sp.]MCF1437812.1 site-2 protease family protein [Shewanella sp.]MCF1458228.1 site-2 protease family protein [Shewanella sp.]